MAANTIITPDPSGAIDQSRTDAEICRRVDNLLAFVDDWDAGRLPGDDDDQGVVAARVDGQRDEIERICDVRAGHTGIGHKGRLWASLELLPAYQALITRSILEDVAELALRPKDQTADAALLAACTDFETLEMTYLGLYYGPTRIEDDRERDAADAASGRGERQKMLLSVITSATATTLDGLRAKARCAAAEITDILTDEDAPVGEIGSSIIRDLVGGFDPVAIAKGGVA